MQDGFKPNAIKEEIQNFKSKEEIQTLLIKMLDLNPQQRISAEDALMEIQSISQFYFSLIQNSNQFSMDQCFLQEYQTHYKEEFDMIESYNKAYIPLIQFNKINYEVNNYLYSLHSNIIINLENEVKYLQDQLLHQQMNDNKIPQEDSYINNVLQIDQIPNFKQNELCFGKKTPVSKNIQPQSFQGEQKQKNKPGKIQRGNSKQSQKSNKSKDSQNSRASNQSILFNIGRKKKCLSPLKLKENKKQNPCSNNQNTPQNNIRQNKWEDDLRRNNQSIYSRKTSNSKGKSIYSDRSNSKYSQHSNKSKNSQTSDKTLVSKGSVFSCRPPISQKQNHLQNTKSTLLKQKQNNLERKDSHQLGALKKNNKVVSQQISRKQSIHQQDSNSKKILHKGVIIRSHQKNQQNLGNIIGQTKQQQYMQNQENKKVSINNYLSPLNKQEPKKIFFESKIKEESLIYQSNLFV